MRIAQISKQLTPSPLPPPPPPPPRRCVDGAGYPEVVQRLPRGQGQERLPQADAAHGGVAQHRRGGGGGGGGGRGGGARQPGTGYGQCCRLISHNCMYTLLTSHAVHFIRFNKILLGYSANGCWYSHAIYNCVS